MPAREPVVPWGLVALVASAGLVVVASGRLRLGGYVLASSFALAALLRAVLPTQRAGALAIRPRWMDVIMWTALGAAVAIGTWAVNIPAPGAP